jgi:hypothetical protein
MSIQQIQAIQQSLNGLIQLVIDQGNDLSNEEQDMLAEVIDQAADKITQLKRDLVQQPIQEDIEVPIPPGADLLWQIANGNQDAFVNYLRTIPDPLLNGLLKNPAQLNQVIEKLKNILPPQPSGQADGIQQAPLNSSNIYGFKFNPRTGRLLVRFQGGATYGYTGVPRGVFEVFKQGAVPAKTTGRNQYGSWWTGKQPSLGAAFYEMIRNGGYPYERLA